MPRTGKCAVHLWVLWGLLLVGAAVPVRALDPETARALVIDTTSRMLEVLGEERERLKREPQRIYHLVNTIVVPRFDARLMARWVLGKYWRTATPRQRDRFTEEFKTLLVRTYATALLEYTDQEVRVLPVRPVRDTKRVTVRTEVRAPGGGAPLSIHYSMYAKKERWKVYDVTIDGVSLVANYRSAFSTEIQRGGMDQLIRLLAEHNRELAGE